MAKRVTVVGGGLSGLFAGVALADRGHDVTVYEQGAAAGGIARTIERSGYQLEPAVGSVRLPDPALSPILDAAGAATTPAPGAASTRHIVRNGHLHSLRPGPALIRTSVLSPAGKLRAVAEPLVRSSSSPGESLAEFWKRRLGNEAGQLAANLMSAGVFAGDADRLAVAAAFPTLVAMEDSAGSVLRGALQRRRRGRPPAHTHLPVGGMSGLIDDIATYLGSRLALENPISAVSGSSGDWFLAGPDTGAEAVVLCVGPDEVSKLLGQSLPTGDPEFAPVAVVFLGAPTSQMSLPDGFGYLSADPGSIAVGVMFESSYAPGRAPDGHSLVKAICGGSRNAETVQWDDEKLEHVVAAELSAATGEPVRPTFSAVVRHQPGIPQYTAAHSRWLDDFDEALRHRGDLDRCGWWYGGPGLTRIAADAHRIAESI